MPKKTPAGPCEIHKPEIALIAPFPGLAATAEPLLKKLPFPVLLAEGDLEQGLAAGRRLKSRGVQLFVSRGGTAQRLKSLDLPVVEIKVTAYDILSALGPLINEKRKIGIIGFDNVIAGASRLSALLHYDLEVFTIGHEREVAGKIAAAQAKGVDLVLGDMVVNNLAETAGLPAVLIESGPEAVLDALHEACERLALIKAEADKNRRHLEVLSLYKTVFEAVEDLIITVDRDGRVDSQNPAARALLKDSLRALTPRRLQGRSFKSLLEAGAPQYNLLAAWGGQKFILDFFPLNTGYGDGPAAVILGRSVRKVESSERRIRNALYLTGHMARYRFADLTGKDKNFLEIIERAKEYAESDSTILIEGESGTGKEMLAQSIHNHKFGADEPFVAINCATLPEHLLESELFGYARGAFTGARAEGKKGLFELAHGGTLFLDEIGELPPSAQAKLLRFLQHGEFYPLGSTTKRTVRTRVLAATNRDLEGMVATGAFRQDLFYRLAVVRIRVPSLANRREDILPLAKLFLHQYGEKFGKKFTALTDSARQALLGHDWTGNVRELRNIMERAALMACGPELDAADLGLRDGCTPDEERTGMTPLTGAGVDLPALLQRMEHDYYEQALGLADGNESQAARLLNVSRDTFRYRRGKLGL